MYRSSVQILFFVVDFILVSVPNGRAVVSTGQRHTTCCSISSAFIYTSKEIAIEPTTTTTKTNSIQCSSQHSHTHTHAQRGSDPNCSLQYLLSTDWLECLRVCVCSVFISSYAREHVFRCSLKSSWQRLCNTCMSQSTAKNKIVMNNLVLFAVHIMYCCIHSPLLLHLSGYFSLTLLVFFMSDTYLYTQASKSSNKQKLRIDAMVLNA